ncbi:DnaJ domain-containing protein [Sandaracinobacter sp. RS1-74]|uniref:J domain-containing protein n=1 Tax=Sandaracinobacteroides sayramensis TaxID=2913411 RepID=UPI001EDAE685|nr:DnaJ domain-containing protein [Sandaracinobacteroides sayramensis]MCG2839975.1 DnaJ domain-containing protein [Sandaracinobacteroides sayramensis]
MARARRSNDWGFPRWRDYDGAGKAPEAQRLCDRVGCSKPGNCPAPKAPNRPERWWFCEEHAAEYNRGWDYFAALTEEEAAAQEAEEQSGQRNYERARHWAWGEGDGSRTRAELDALKYLDLPPDADEAAIKAAHRRLAKENHPDLNPGDEEAAKRFQAAQAAYEILRSAAERRAEKQKA